MPKRKLKVFLCHSPNDGVIVRELYRRLSREGWIEVWFGEEKLFPGHDWNLEIEKAVSAAESAIVCISQSSTTQQGSVQRELRLILDAAQNMPQGTIFIIPLKLEECEPPFLLRSLQFANYFENDRERGYERLLGGLRARANGLGIAAAKSASDHSKAPVNTSAATPINLSGDVGIGRDVYGSTIITGNHNRVTIYGDPQPRLPGDASTDAPAPEKPSGPAIDR